FGWLCFCCVGFRWLMVCCCVWGCGVGCVVGWGFGGGGGVWCWLWRWVLGALAGGGGGVVLFGFFCVCVCSGWFVGCVGFVVVWVGCCGGCGGCGCGGVCVGWLFWVVVGGLLVGVVFVWGVWLIGCCCLLVWCVLLFWCVWCGWFWVLFGLFWVFWLLWVWGVLFWLCGCVCCGVLLWLPSIWTVVLFCFGKRRALTGFYGFGVASVCIQAQPILIFISLLFIRGYPGC
ncbi:hypothetical protein RA264_27530, partial [Pseudomonas syringae pv. tagetis]|uniref:hypothetical protein n=1 Tax=Pseudomonas syringae group genomosp. 7 TaxID=251699 RepID=UPI00376FED43